MKTLVRFLAVTMIFACCSLPARASAAPIIILTIDASDSPLHLLHGREIVRVQPGPLTLCYPEWIPGEHSATGPILDLVGLHISANGSSVRWRRDLVDMYAFHCTVPDGVSSIEVTYDFILPPAGRGFSSAGSSTPVLLVLSWNQVVLYPAGIKPADIGVEPHLKLPAGWKFGTALTIEGETGSDIRFTPVPLTMLIDSPVLTGRFFRRIDITGSLPVPHILNMVSDDSVALDMPEQLINGYKQLVVEANDLFGARHYEHYDFLYTLSDHVAHFGLEHHQSSDDRVDEYTLLDGDKTLTSAGLLPHEMVHSWNGKYRRPAGLATGDFSTPMKDDLLWIYEGLTEYLGDVLTARSGLRSPEQYRENLALVAAGLDNEPGRRWRPLQDAADMAPLLYEARTDWNSYRRGVDFYDEGELIWLEADVIIRTKTNGKKSLDDFCKLFYGPPDTGPVTKPYTLDDMLSAMNSVVPYDWKSFFSERLESTSPHAPLGGITSGGWKLVYRDSVSDMQEARENAGRDIDMRFSLGIVINDDGTLRDVLPGTPAARAGLVPTMRLVAVDGKRYSVGILRDIVRASKSSTAPIEILAQDGSLYAPHRLDYHGGERYPYLERDESHPDIIGNIIHPVEE